MGVSPAQTAGPAVAPRGLGSLSRPWSGRDEGVVAIAANGFAERERPPAPNDPTSDDADLARRLRARDPTALAIVYDRHAAAVHGLVLSVLRDPQLAEEVTHDVFLGLWQRPDAFDARRGTFPAWLLRVARNRAIDLLRHQREHPFSPATSDEGVAADPTQRLVDPDPGPPEQVLRRLARQDVQAALTRLSPDQSRLLHLAYFEGFTQREIAARLGRPLGTVKSQIRVAMHRLADLLAPPPPAAPPASGYPAVPVRPVPIGAPRRDVTEDAP